METLFWFIIGLGFFTVVGHLLWKGFAWLLGYRVQTFRHTSASAGAVAPRPVMPIASSDTDPIRTTAVQLLALQRKGLIDPNIYVKVMSALRADSAALPPVAPLAAENSATAARSYTEIGVSSGEVRAQSPAAPQTIGATQPQRSSQRPPPLPVTPRLVRDVPQSVPTTLPVIIAPRAPRRTVSQVLATFMEARNIRWGELIGGLLIVGCSIALVVSFWAQITQRPVFKFSIFTAITTALFGVGLYSEHRWKLPTTSRGILLIATLLVPLNCLAFAAFSPAGAPGSFALISQGIALVLFTWLLWLASKVIARRWPALMTAATAGLSASVLALRVLTPAQPSAAQLLELGLIPVGGYLVSTAAMLRQARQHKRIHLPVANAVFLFLGVMTFATTIAMGLLVWQSATASAVFSSQDFGWVMRRIAPLVSVGGLPALAAGLLLWRRVTGKVMSKIRTAGTSVAVIGAMVMLAGIVLAWPDPAAIIPVAVCDFLALTLIALLYEIPAAHFLAMPCLWIAWLVGFHAFAGHVGWTATTQAMADTLRQPVGGAAMTPLVLLITGASWLLARLKRIGDANAFSRLAIAGAIISVAMLNFAGFAQQGDPNGAAWIYGVYAAIAFALGWRNKRQAVSWLAWALLGGAIAQFFVSHHITPRPWPVALLTWASIAAIVRCLLPRLGDKAKELHANQTFSIALLDSTVAVVIALAGLSFAGFGIGSVILFWSAGIVLAIAVVDESAGILLASQVALCVATVIGVLSQMAHFAWFTHSSSALLEPWTIQIEAIALAAWCLTAAMVRRFLRHATTTRLLEPAHLFYTVLSGILVATLMALGAYGVGSGLGIEFGFEHRAVLTLVDPAELYAVGVGSWLLLAALVGIFAIECATDTFACIALFVTGWAACLLVAARWTDVAATASMLRWASSAYLLIASVPWLLKRPFGRLAVRNTMLGLGITPVVILTGIAVTNVAAGQALGGPLASSLFARTGPTASYAFPLLIVAGMLVLHGWRNSQAAFAFAGSFAACFAVTSGFVMAIHPTGIGLGPSDVLHVLELNAIVLALWAIGASTAWWSWDSRAPSDDPPIYIKMQAVIAAALAGTVLVPAVVVLAIVPDAVWLVKSAGDIWGWSAVLSVVAAAIVRRHFHPSGLRVRTLSLGLLALAALFACSVQGYGPRGGWPGFHALLVGNTLVSWLILGYGAWLAAKLVGSSIAGADTTSTAPGDVIAYHRPAQTSLETAAARASLIFGNERLLPSVIHWATAVASLAIVLALRGTWADPAGPWWPVGTITAAASLLAMISCWAWRPNMLYPAAGLLNLGASIWFTDGGWNLPGSRLLNFLCVNIIMLALPGIAWLVLELQIFKHGALPGTKRRLPAHRAAAFCSILLLGAVSLTGAIGRLAEAQWPLPAELLAILATVTTLALTVSCLWDAKALNVPASLYALGLMAAALVLEYSHLSGKNLALASILSVAGYTLFTAILWNIRGKLSDLAMHLRAPVEGRSWTFGWLEIASTTVAGVVTASAFWADFAFDKTSIRLIVALAAISQGAALALLSRGDRKLALRQSALSIVAAATVAFGWAWMSPAITTVLERAVVVFTTLAGVTALYLLLLPRLLKPQTLWRDACQSLGRQVAAAATLALAFTLGAEIYCQIEFGSVPMRPAAIALVLACLLGGCAGAIYASIRATHLSDRIRVGCVYGTEVLLALAFAHAKLTMPYLFHGILHAYWPLVMMAIAFVGVGAGEILRRQHQLILADPLQRTGIFLPLLPVLAFWAAPPAAVNMGQLLLTIAVFYTLVAALRRSVAFGVLAAFAANGALWHLLAHTPGWGFFQHPQVWLIPIALAVLVASQLNSDRLSAEQLRLVRYGSLIVVYASSTADVFLNGVAVAPWLPLVLAGLSVAGVLTGIVMHIRPFLYLGTMFLLLSVITMIYYASSQLHWTWIWYVAGIALGAGIIVLFAVFEKRKAV